jgi:hypothetical protein
MSVRPLRGPSDFPMTSPVALFLDFSLPNATTWFYFSCILAVALFFKFGRLLSMRNWDVITMFLLVPGLLVVHLLRPQPQVGPQHPAALAAGLVGQAVLSAEPLVATGRMATQVQCCVPHVEARRWVWYGYLWLLAGSAYFFCRCLVDLALVQRPALAPNLNFGGLAWFAGALMVCLIVVAFRQAERATPSTPLPADAALAGPESASLALAREWLAPPSWVHSLGAVLCHISIVLGLIVIGWRIFQDAHAGMAAATFYLLLPYTGLNMGQVQHPLPMAILVWAVAAYRWPMLMGALLGLAGAATYFPVLLLPIWFSFYRGRGAGRFLFGFVLMLAGCLGAVALVLSGQGDLEPILRETWAQAAWQPWRVPTTESFWTDIPWAYRIPVFFAYLAFVVVTFFWPSGKNLAEALAMTTAVLIGIQFWYADHGGLYVLWYLPLLLLLVFRPNLHDRLAPPIAPDSDWLTRLGRWLRRGMRWLVRMPEPAQV